MNLLKQNDYKFVRKDAEGNDITKDYMKEHGDMVTNYYALMTRLTHGVYVDSKKPHYERFEPNMRHLSFINEFMGEFMYVSGIGAIEGRYQDEKNEFGYGG